LTGDGGGNDLRPSHPSASYRGGVRARWACPSSGGPLEACATSGADESAGGGCTARHHYPAARSARVPPSRRGGRRVGAERARAPRVGGRAGPGRARGGGPEKIRVAPRSSRLIAAPMPYRAIVGRTWTRARTSPSHRSLSVGRVAFQYNGQR